MLHKDYMDNHLELFSLRLGQQLLAVSITVMLHVHVAALIALMTSLSGPFSLK